MIPVTNLMMRSSFFMPTIMTASTVAMSSPTAVKMSPTMLDNPIWAETMNMVTIPMLSSPIRSNVRSTTMDEKPDANPVPSFSPRM